MDTITDDNYPSLIGEERRRRILEVLARRGAVQVTALTKALRCSEATLRRDLLRLEREGRLRRTHGGAVDLADGPDLELPPQDKAVLQVTEKRAIATAAARLIHPGEVIALNGGTTTMELARKLRAIDDLRVVTNSIGVATELAGLPGVEVTVTGGTLRGTLELIGPLAEQSLPNLFVDMAFIGVDGLTVEHGLTTYNQAEAQTNRTMIAQARSVVVVADHTKFGRRTMALIVPISRISAVVTDAGVAAEQLDALRMAGVEVVIGV